MKKKDKLSRLQGQIKGLMAEAGINQKRMAAITGVSRSTISRHLSSPGDMTLFELVILLDAAGADLSIERGEQ